MHKFSAPLLLAVAVLTVFLVLGFPLVAANGYHYTGSYNHYSDYGNNPNYFNNPGQFNCNYQNHSACDSLNTTIISGKIYNSTNKTLANATVTITCDHNGTNYTQTTQTLWNGPFKGTFLVKFPDSQCDTKDKVFITAVKDNFVGSASSTVKDLFGSDHRHHRFCDIDFATVRVYLNMIPEFGFTAGALTLVSALGIFFVVRRK